MLGREDGAPPPVDLEAERRIGNFVRMLIQGGHVACVHDLSEGGLVAAAAETALASGVGITLNVEPGPRAHALLFAEDQARYLVATADPDTLLQAARTAGVFADVVGQAGGDRLACPGLFDLSLAELRQAHEGWMPGFMGD
jgi:phosphoribosylformylglycinamidine synthase